MINKHIFSIKSSVKKYCIEKTLERLTPLIKNKIPIKLPNWPTSPKYEKALKKCNAIIIPSHINSFDIIKNSRLVLSNGLSSIISEAHYMGIPTINFIEEYIFPFYIQSQLFDSFHDCILCHYEQLDDILSNCTFNPSSPLLKPFDFKKAVLSIQKIFDKKIDILNHCLNLATNAKLLK